MKKHELRDRDAIITREGIIFRVYGYFHPPEKYVCDVEYAPANIYKSKNEKAIRTGGNQIYYKFYEHEGLEFIMKNYPQYTILYEPLQERLVGVQENQIHKIRKPEIVLKRILSYESEDKLIKALREVLDFIFEHSKLKIENLGVFGSILHGFYHPKFSDLDFVIYGKSQLEELRSLLSDFYGSDTPLRNEFEDLSSVSGKLWKFKNYSLKEYVWHQKRKLIYSLYDCVSANRIIKVEFEPVKTWNEIYNEYNSNSRVKKIGWTKALVKILDASEGSFIPSIYWVEPVKIISGIKCDAIRILSYVEEFRLQVFEDEIAYVEGYVEEVSSEEGCFHQITLTYCDRYYEQVLKIWKG